MKYHCSSIVPFACLFSLSLLLSAPGCINTHGNRHSDRPMLTRTTELRRNVGREVMLVGTAHSEPSLGTTLVLMGGRVQLPDFAWPPELVGRRVSVSGTLLDFRLWPDVSGEPLRVYRLGGVESAEQWSR